MQEVGRPALMHAANEGRPVCLRLLIQAKAELNFQAKVRLSDGVVLVSGCNIDYLVLESRL